MVFLFGFCGVAIGIECRKTLVECLGIVCREELSDFGRENDDRNGIIQLLCDFVSGFHWCGLADSECFRFRGIESKRIPQAVTLQNARDLVHARMD